MTLNLGLRFDSTNSYVPAQTRPGGRFIQPISFSEIDDVPNWKDISPRLGASYDLFGNGKTAVKGFLSRYVNAQGASLASAVNPANAIVLSATRTWTDTNGNLVPDCDLTNNAANGECGAQSANQFGTPRVVTSYSPDLTSGWGVRDYTWQGSMSVQHELRSNVGVNFGYFRTWYGNFTVIANLATPASAFSPYCITTPTDSRLGQFSGQQVCGLYNVNPAQFGQVNNLVTLASKYGSQSEVYNGFEFTSRVRFQGEGLLQGGLTVGRTVTDNCFTVDTPQQRQPGSPFCHVSPPWSAGTQFKVAVVYPLLFGLQASANYQNVQPFQYTVNYVATNAQVAPSLGRNLAAGPNATVTIPIVPPGTFYEARINQLDLRLTKAWKVRATRVRGMFDIYNIFNCNAVLSEITTYGPAFRTPTQILGGRLLKFGAQVDF
jgi:hypothetical protein